MKKVIIYVEGFIFINVLWAITYKAVNSDFAPNPLAVYQSFRLFFIEGIPMHILASTYRIIIGMGIALLVGSIIGYFMGTKTICNTVLNPLVYILYPIPKAILLPMMAIFMGGGEVSCILIVSVVLIFHVILSVRYKIMSVERVTIDYLVSLGATNKQIVNYIYVPEIIPEIINNIRARIKSAISILLFSEAFGNGKGMGFYVISAWFKNDFISLYKGTIVVCVLGTILFYLVDIAENKVVKWKGKN